MPAISALSDLTNRTISAATTVSSSDHESWRNDVESRVANLNDVVADLENNHSGTSAPTDNAVEGKLFANTTNNPAELFFDPDGSGADIRVVMETHTQTLTNKTFGTGGTATHKPMGSINADPTAVSRSTTGVLITYTLPADTLDANNKLLRITLWGTKTGTTATADVQFRFGTTPTARVTHTIAQSAAGWRIEVIAIRVSSSAVDMPGTRIEGTTITPFSIVLTSGIDLTADQTIDINLSSINASDSVSQDGMLVELLN